MSFQPSDASSDKSSKHQTSKDLDTVISDLVKKHQGSETLSHTSAQSTKEKATEKSTSISLTNTPQAKVNPEEPKMTENPHSESTKSSVSKEETTQTKTEEPTEVDFYKQLEQSLELYDMVLNIDNLCAIKQGYEVYGRNIDREVRGRKVAIVGSFKVGKTWLVKRLSHMELKDSKIIPTIGLSVKLPNPMDQPQGAPSMQTLPRRVRINPVPVEPLPKSDSIYDLIYMDCAGTDKPCSSSLLYSTIATEYFLRDFMVTLAQRVILVIDKFDREAVRQIERLKNMYNNRHPIHPISPENRLIIVHNYSDLADLAVLDNKINQVASTYYNGTLESWQTLTMAPNSNQCFYTTPDTAHCFMLNDTKFKERNDVVLNWIHNMHYTVNVESVNIIKCFMDTASTQLERYLRGWDSEFKFKLEKVDDNTSLLVPYLPENSVNNYQWDNEQQKETWIHKNQELLTNKDEPFQLQSLQYTDQGITSESVQELKGRVEVDYSKNIITYHIQAPGFVSENKNEKWITELKVWNNCCVKIRIKIDEPPKRPNVKLLYNTINYGEGVYFYKIPQDENDENNVRFKQPATKKELWDRLVVENGFIDLTLDLQTFKEE